MNTIKILTRRLREYAEIYAVNERMIQDYPMLGRLLIQSADTIESLCKNKSDNGWIPCSERLPEDGQKVLATHKGGLNPNLQVIEHVFRGGEFLYNWDMDTGFKSPTFGQRYMGDVIAWQPLPSPYEVKSDE